LSQPREQYSILVVTAAVVVAGTVVVGLIIVVVGSTVVVSPVTNLNFTIHPSYKLSSKNATHSISVPYMEWDLPLKSTVT